MTLLLLGIAAICLILVGLLYLEQFIPPDA